MSFFFPHIKSTQHINIKHRNLCEGRPHQQDFRQLDVLKRIVASIYRTSFHLSDQKEKKAWRQDPCAHQPKVTPHSTLLIETGLANWYHFTGSLVVFQTAESWERGPNSQGPSSDTNECTSNPGLIGKPQS